MEGTSSIKYFIRVDTILKVDIYFIKVDITTKGNLDFKDIRAYLVLVVGTQH
jgi:hypothetical protein